MSLLAIEGLTLSAGGAVLVRDLSLHIEPGERVGLIGESGSGKSLTAMAATGLLPPDIDVRGSVLLGGQEVIGTPDRELDRLRGSVAAFVFQEPLTALDPLLRLGRQVAEPLRRTARREGRALSGMALDRAVVQLLEQVALPQPERVARSYPHEVSGGQRQRVAIAMALACRPRLLIADEPTTALDVTTQAEILALLGNLVRDRDMALLFISHDLPVVAAVVDRVVVLRQGVAVETGPVGRVFDAPQHEYTRALVAAARAFDAALDGAA
ncbi:ABC transporter ATP-binding protein [Kaistia algarum]|uniref:ATP-binding cassette domain-containing protein n=1 Tax=Kaistia algarum TaxID=2083279 RepID=UPI000CE7914D|nr:ABC transporter ATP-binding protein [Kaistia algarum]MCX5513999.1 ABC transporter ATP-binding protein [Kaistia algarum]PPE78036.1 ABC transporter ATP-binding protein [Kaistia algarum]